MIIQRSSGPDPGFPGIDPGPLSESAHQIENQAYDQDQANPPAPIGWAAKVESAAAEQQNEDKYDQ